MGIVTPVLLCQVRYFVLDGARLPPHDAGQNCGRTISVLSLHAIPHREMHHVPFLCASSRLDHLIEIIVVRLSKPPTAMVSQTSSKYIRITLEPCANSHYHATFSQYFWSTVVEVLINLL